MVALFALERLAKQSPELAYTRWAKIAGYFPLSEQHYFYGRLAYQAARNLDPRALQWYKAAADTPLDDRQSAWRVRAALRVQDWPEVLASSQCDERAAATRYRLAILEGARAAGTGQARRSQSDICPVERDFNFYGQLASSELADPVLSEAKPVYKPDQQAIDAVSALPGVQRTLALYRMGLRNEALEEWRWVLRNLNDRELLTAAEIALRNKMYDRAIGAAEKTVSDA